MPIRVEIVSQDRMVYEGDAEVVVVPGVAGEMGILDGKHDDLPEQAFMMVGQIEEAREKAEQMAKA